MFDTLSTRKLRLICFLLLWVHLSSAAQPLQDRTALQDIIRDKCGIDNPLYAAKEQIACLDEPYRDWIFGLIDANPKADAVAQIKKGEFKFLEIVHAWGGPTLPRVECFVNWPRKQLHGSLFFSDAISGQDDIYWREWAEEYVAKFNEEMVSNINFPYRDLCMPIKGEMRSNKITKSQSNLTLENWIQRTFDVNADETITSAARLGKSDKVKSMLTLNPEKIHDRDIFEYSALDWSILRSDERLVKSLIEAGSRVDGVEKKNARRELNIRTAATPLYLAIATKNSNITKLILAAGADANKLSSKLPNIGGSGDSFVNAWPLSTAVSLNLPEVVELLLANGADVNGENAGEPPIFGAVENNYIEVLRILLDSGADISVRDRSDIAPIQTAAERKNYVALQLLMNKGSARLARSDIEQKLWEKAYKAKRNEILSHLVAFGGNVNLAKRNEQRKLLTAIRQNKLDTIKSIIEMLDIRFQNLTIAIAKGHLSFVQDIFQDGAKPVRNYAYSELAVALEDAQTDIGNWLLESGANPDAKITPSKLEWLLPNSEYDKTSYGTVTTLDNRKFRGPLVRDKHGRGLPDVVHALTFRHGPVTLTKAVAEKSTIEISDNARQFSIPLHNALFGYRDHKDIAILEYALQYDRIDPSSAKADLFLSELCFWTMRVNIEAFSYFIQKGFLPNKISHAEQDGNDFLYEESALIECMDSDARAAIMLLEKGADPNQRSKGGQPALQAAIEKIGSYGETLPYENVVKLLLVKGANPATTHYGRNAFDVAQSGKRYWDDEYQERLDYVIKLLADYGLTEPANEFSDDDPYPRSSEKYEPPIPVQ